MRRPIRRVHGAARAERRIAADGSDVLAYAGAADAMPMRTVMSVLALVAATSAASAQSVLARNHEVVLAVGDPAPGLPGLVVSGAASSLDAPVIDQDGTLLFRARLAGAVNSYDDRALFVGRSKDDLRLVLRAGDQAPGLPPGILLRTNSPTSGSLGIPGACRISPYGELLFLQVGLYDPLAPANTPPSADTACYWGQAGNLVLLAREGDPVPFLAPGIAWGPFLASIQANHVNAAGQVLFAASLVGATATDDGLLVTGTAGSLAPVLREGQTFAGGEVVVTVSGATGLSNVLQLNEAGMVLHEVGFATTAPSTATPANNRALAVWQAGVTTLVAREGSQAPGLPAGVVLGNPGLTWAPNLGAVAFTASGKVAFQAQLDQGGTVVGVDDHAVFFGDAFQLAPICRRGDLVPGMANGERFGLAGSTSVTCNDEGQAAFVGALTGPSVTTANDSAAFLYDRGAWTALAREGSPLAAGVLPPSPNGPWIVAAINAGANNPQLDGRGDVLLPLGVSDGVVAKSILVAFLRGVGPRLQWDFHEPLLVQGAPATATSFTTTAGANSGDGSPSHWNSQGDLAVRANLATGAACILRGHVGALQAGPATIDTFAGGAQDVAIDCGAARAFHICVLLGGVSGARPGTPSPLGPQTIPLNFDVWTQLSLDLANTVIYPNSLRVLDAAGTGAARFWLPAGIVGLPAQIHHAAVTLDASLQSTFVSEPVAVRLF